MDVDLEQMLKRASSDLERAESDFRAAQERVEAAQRHMDELRVMRDGALMLVQRYGQAAPIVQVTDAVPAAGTLSVKREGVSNAASLNASPDAENQTELVMGILGDGKSAHTSVVHDKLNAAGYNFTYDQVRSTLGYLKRKGRIAHVGPATWRLVQAPGSASEYSR